MLNLIRCPLINMHIHNALPKKQIFSDHQTLHNRTTRIPLEKSPPCPHHHSSHVSYRSRSQRSDIPYQTPHRSLFMQGDSSQVFSLQNLSAHLLPHSSHHGDFLWLEPRLPFRHYNRPISAPKCLVPETLELRPTALLLQAPS